MDHFSSLFKYVGVMAHAMLLPLPPTATNNNRKRPSNGALVKENGACRHVVKYFRLDTSERNLFLLFHCMA